MEGVNEEEFKDFNTVDRLSEESEEDVILNVEAVRTYAQQQLAHLEHGQFFDGDDRQPAAVVKRLVNDVLALTDVLRTLNELRSNIIGTQSSTWSNTLYPFVAILNDAGLEQFDPTEDQMRQHMDCYGGAGGYPGNILREPPEDYCRPYGKLQDLQRAVRRFLADPSDKNRGFLTNVVER